MKKVLVTGGTVFVSRYIAEYYAKKGFEVYVLNRNTKTQSEGVKLICADLLMQYWKTDHNSVYLMWEIKR